MKAWRLLRKEFLREAFSGEGASLYGGRWNSKGTAVVYLGEHLSLAALEMFVRLTRRDSGIVFAAVPVEIPDSLPIETVSAGELPKEWREEPPPKTTQELGDRWAEEGRTALLKVPSVIVPHEFNLVLNPLHPDFPKVNTGHPSEFSFDPRMWK